VFGYKTTKYSTVARMKIQYIFKRGTKLVRTELVSCRRNISVFCKHGDISAIARNPEPLLICLININHIEMSGIGEFVADRNLIRKLNLSIQYSCTETETIMTVDCYVNTVSEQLLLDSILNRTLQEEVL